jgi:hypothetical protein
MPRPRQGEQPLTAAERQARRRDKLAYEAGRMRGALARIATAKTVREARQIAAKALASETQQ